jgi:hypothetical protein
MLRDLPGQLELLGQQLDPQFGLGLDPAELELSWSSFPTNSGQALANQKLIVVEEVTTSLG